MRLLYPKNFGDVINSLGCVTRDNVEAALLSVSGGSERRGPVQNKPSCIDSMNFCTCT